jgi:hypothetical protein
LPEEAGLYRYGETPQDKQTENPTEAHNHALDALRYLISRLPKMRAAELREGAETPLAA